MEIPLPKFKKGVRLGPAFMSVDLRRPQFPPRSGSIGYEQSSHSTGKTKTISLWGGPAKVVLGVSSVSSIPDFISEALKKGSGAFRYQAPQ